MSARESIIPVFVPHLGCPQNCVFCNQNHISGQQQPATAETVDAAIASAQGMSLPEGRRQLAFYGGSFTAIPEIEQLALLEAAKRHLDAGDISSVRLSTRPDAIDENILARLKKFGVETIELGAQSMCPEVLRLAGRGHSAEDVEHASKLIKAAGFSLILQMMTGLPGDSPERTAETAKKIIALRPDGVRIYPTVIVVDTPLYAMWKRGEYREHSVEDAVEYCAAIVPMFEKAGIPIIRLGLNPTEDLSSGEAAGGAYHPALGELVKSRIMLRRAQELLINVAPGSDVTLLVNPSQISQMTGQHRQNVLYLQEKLQLRSIKIKGADIPAGEIKVMN